MGQVQINDGTPLRPGWNCQDDADSGFYRIGSNNLGLALGGLKVWDYAATITGVYYASANAVAYELAGYKTRGTVASPTVITTGDDLFRVAAYGYSGVGGYVKAAEIRFDSAGTIATTRVAGQIIFATGTDAAPTALTDRLTIDQAGNLLFNATTARGDAPAFTLLGASSASQAIALVLEQPNTGGSNGLDIDFLGHDSADAVATLATIQIAKNGAWTSGTATTYNTSVAFIIREDNAEVTYLQLIGGNDHVSLPNRPLSIAVAVGAPAALADAARLGAADAAADDTRLAVQSQAGSVILIGNDTVRATWATQATADATVDLGAVSGSIYSLVRITSSLRYKTIIGPSPLDSRAIYGFPLPEWESQANDKGRRGYSPIAEYAFAAHPSFAQLDTEGQPVGINWTHLSTAMLMELRSHDQRLAALEDTKARLREALADPETREWLRAELGA